MVNITKKIVNIFKKIKENITAEPILGCHVFTSTLTKVATQNLYLDKACRVGLKFNEDVCDHLKLRNITNYQYEGEQVQAIAASVNAWKSVIATLVPCILIIFVGGWSDKTGRRKACLLIPLISELLTNIGLMINVYFMFGLPIEVAAFTSSLLPAITGGWYTLFLGAYCYISDLTSKDNRTFRFGVLNFFMELSTSVGTVLSGILLKHMGYYGVYGMCSILTSCAFVYGFYYLEESPRFTEIQQKSKDEIDRNIMRNIFDLNYLKSTADILFQKGPNNRRLNFMIFLLIMCFYQGSQAGDASIFYLFMRYKFNMNEVSLSIFSSFNFTLHMIGVFLFLTVFCKLLKLEDNVIGIISCLGKTGSYLVYAFAQSIDFVYFAPIVDMLASGTFIVLRSIASKSVIASDQAKVSSIFELVDTSMSTIFVPIFGKVYIATLELYKGEAVYFLGAALTLTASIAFVWLSLENRFTEKQKRMKETECTHQVSKL